jgi:NADPH-dependent ferric siderophore reductase
MSQTAIHSLPMILDEVEAVRVERLSRSFVRVELGGACLADFGVAGPSYDQRIKLVFPDGDGPLPSFAGADESWFGSWLERPVEVRGHMRTYTLREVRGEGEATRLVVDFVLHVEDGETGPGSAWAAGASVGDRVVVLAPRRGEEYGGIEFDPGTAGRLLLAGDETAVPAICAVLGQLPGRRPARRSSRCRQRPTCRLPRTPRVSRSYGCHATASRSAPCCTPPCWPTWARGLRRWWSPTRSTRTYGRPRCTRPPVRTSTPW